MSQNLLRVPTPEGRVAGDDLDPDSGGGGGGTATMEGERQIQRGGARTALFQTPASLVRRNQYDGHDGAAGRAPAKAGGRPDHHQSHRTPMQPRRRGAPPDLVDENDNNSHREKDTDEVKDGNEEEEEEEEEMVTLENQRMIRQTQQQQQQPHHDATYLRRTPGANAMHRSRYHTTTPQQRNPSMRRTPGATAMHRSATGGPGGVGAGKGGRGGGSGADASAPVVVAGGETPPVLRFGLTLTTPVGAGKPQLGEGGGGGGGRPPPTPASAKPSLTTAQRPPLGPAAAPTPSSTHAQASNGNVGRDREKYVYTPAGLALSKNPHLRIAGEDGRDPTTGAFSPATVRLTESLDQLMNEDDEDDVGVTSMEDGVADDLDDGGRVVVVEPRPVAVLDSGGSTAPATSSSSGVATSTSVSAVRVVPPTKKPHQQQQEGDGGTAIMMEDWCETYTFDPNDEEKLLSSLVGGSASGGKFTNSAKIPARGFAGRKSPSKGLQSQNHHQQQHRRNRSRSSPPSQQEHGAFQQLNRPQHQHPKPLRQLHPPPADHNGGRSDIGKNGCFQRYSGSGAGGTDATNRGGGAGASSGGGGFSRPLNFDPTGARKGGAFAPPKPTATAVHNPMPKKPGAAQTQHQKQTQQQQPPPTPQQGQQQRRHQEEQHQQQQRQQQQQGEGQQGDGMAGGEAEGPQQIVIHHHHHYGPGSQPQPPAPHQQQPYMSDAYFIPHPHPSDDPSRVVSPHHHHPFGADSPLHMFPVEPQHHQHHLFGADSPHLFVESPLHFEYGQPPQPNPHAHPAVQQQQQQQPGWSDGNLYGAGLHHHHPAMSPVNVPTPVMSPLTVPPVPPAYENGPVIDGWTASQQQQPQLPQFGLLPPMVPGASGPWHDWPGGNHAAAGGGGWGATGGSGGSILPPPLAPPPGQQQQGNGGAQHQHQHHAGMMSVSPTPLPPPHRMSPLAPSWVDMNQQHPPPGPEPFQPGPDFQPQQQQQQQQQQQPGQGGKRQQQQQQKKSKAGKGGGDSNDNSSSEQAHQGKEEGGRKDPPFEAPPAMGAENADPQSRPKSLSKAVDDGGAGSGVNSKLQQQEQAGVASSRKSNQKGRPNGGKKDRTTVTAAFAKEEDASAAAKSGGKKTLSFTSESFKKGGKKKKQQQQALADASNAQGSEPGRVERGGSGRNSPAEDEASAPIVDPADLKRAELNESPATRLAFKEFYRKFHALERSSFAEAEEYAHRILLQEEMDESSESKSGPSSSATTPILPVTVHWRVYLELADLAKRSNSVDEARALYRTACELQPYACQGWLEHSKLEEECGNLTRCSSLLYEGLRYCEYNESLLTRAIKHEEKTGNLNGARVLLARLKHVGIEKVWRTVLEGALLEARAGNIAMARRVLKYLMHHVPWYAPLYLEAYKLERDAERPADALVVVERGLREIPRYGPLWFGAFRLCEGLDLAEGSYDLPRTMDMVDRATGNISRELLWKVHLEAAQAQERAAMLKVDANPDKGSLNEHLGPSRNRFARTVLACPPNLCWKVWLAGGKMELSAGRTDVARKLFLRASEVVPPKGRPAVLLECARLEEFAGDVDLARAILCKARNDSSSSDWKVWLESVSLEVRCGECSRAASLACRALEVHTGTGRLWSALVQLRERDGEEAQMQALKQALRAVPKSGEVWGEGARIHLNPFTPNFDLDRAAQHLDFATRFTPQYGDSFLETLRLELLTKWIAPMAEPFIEEMKHRLVDVNIANVDEFYAVVGECAREAAREVKNVLRKSSAGKSINGEQDSNAKDNAEGSMPNASISDSGASKVDTSDLELRCANADPNYGKLWFKCRIRPSDTARNVLVRAKGMITSDLANFAHIYVGAMMRREGAIIALRKDLMTANKSPLPLVEPGNGKKKETIRQNASRNVSEGSIEWDSMLETGLRAAPTLEDLFKKSDVGLLESSISGAAFVTGLVEANSHEALESLSLIERRKVLFGSDLLLSWKSP